MTNVTSISKEKMNMALSTSVLFDMSEPDAIWQAEQKGEIPKGSYREYMLERLNDPLPLREKDFEYYKNLSLHEEIQVLLMSRNSTLTGYRAVKTLIDNGLTPESYVFTNGASVAEYCKIYKADMFITSSQADRDKAHELGVPSVLSDHIRPLEEIDVQSLIPRKKAVPLLTRPRSINDQDAQSPSPKPDFDNARRLSSIAFDRDRVLHGPEDDEYFAEHGLKDYRERQVQLRGVPIEEGLFYDVYKKMVRLRYVFLVHSITARGAEAAIRDICDSVKKGLEHNGESHMISSGQIKTQKFEIQAEMERRYGTTPLVDDGKSHIELSRQNGMMGLHVFAGGTKFHLGA